MRGSSSGGMPTPVSATASTARAVLPAPAVMLDRAAGAACTSPRCRRGWRGPAAAGCGRRRRTTPCGDVGARMLTPLLLGDVLVEVHRLRTSSRQSVALARRRHRAGLGLGDVHQRVEHRHDAVGLLEAVGQRVARSASRIARRAARSRPSPRRRAIGVRRSCATLSSAPRMPATTASMRSSMRVDEDAQLAERIPGRCTGTRALVRPVRMMPRTVSASVAHRLQRRPREHRAARAAAISTMSSEVEEQRRGGSAGAARRARSVLLPTWNSVPSRKPHRRHLEHVRRRPAGLERRPTPVAGERGLGQLRRGRSRAILPAC